MKVKVIYILTYCVAKDKEEIIVAKLSFRLLSGGIAEQNKSIDLNSYYPGNFVVQTTEYPNGVFNVTGVDVLNQEMTLKQINCGSNHWQPNSDGFTRGQDDTCEQTCPYQSICPLPSSTNG